MGWFCVGNDVIKSYTNDAQKSNILQVQKMGRNKLSG